MPTGRIGLGRLASESMYAWLLDSSPGEYRWGEVPDPEPGPGQVRIVPVTSALNHMDLWLTRGRPAPRVFPHVPGADVAGIVESLGAGVTVFSEGDEVVVNPALVPREALVDGVDAVLDESMGILGEHCWGAHGGLVVVDAHQLHAKPPGRSWADSAAFPIAHSTAWRLLRRAGIESGQVVLVTGVGGGVATAAMMLAIHLGAEVIATSREADKRRLAMELGASGAVDSDEDYPRGCDIVFDSIGPATWDRAMGALRRGGRMCVCGATSGTTTELDLTKLFWRQLDIIGGSCASQVEFAEVTAMVDAGAGVVVDRTYKVSDYPAALERLRSAGQVGKVVLEHPAAGL